MRSFRIQDKRLIYLFYRILPGKTLSLLLLFVFVHYFAFSQDKKIAFQSLYEGLSHNQVKCILKDSKGFMWFGTHDGLNKFDGSNFVIYENNPFDSGSLCHNSINAIIEDRHKNIWIGTSNGLNLYNRDKDNFSKISNFGERNILYVSALFYDSNDVLWVGTSGNGLYLYDIRNTRLISYTHNDNDTQSICSNFISGILSDHDKNIWISTRNGLDLFNSKDKTFTHFVHSPNDRESLSANNLSSLTLDKEGNLWIGTYGGGLNKLVKKNNKYTFQIFQKTDKPGSINHNNILSLRADHKGNLWIGTENGGLNCLLNKTNKFINYYSEDGNPKSISSNSIWSIYEDNIGILWIGTYNKGLNIIDKKFEKFDLIQRNGYTGNTLINNNVKCFAEDSQGNLWIGTDGGGLCCFNTKTRQFASKADNSKLSSNAIMTILPDSRQNIWVGTWAGGIELFNKNGTKVKNYKNEIGLRPGNNIISLLEDKKGNIWAGSSGRGLFIYNKTTDNFIQVLDTTQKTNLTNTAFICDLMEDSDNNIWIGTLFGLVLLKTNTDGTLSFSEFSHSANPKSISSFRITAIFEDSKKNLWIGTEEGLNLFNKHDSSFKVYQKQNGLPNNSIKGILEDNKGYLWISSNKGISKFNPAKGTFENFSQKDGLNTNEFNLLSCIKTKSGEFFFGGNNGMNAFYPDSIKVNTYIPAVYITDLMIFNHPVKIGVEGSPLKKNITETSKITLTYKQSSFTIEFVALNYTRSAKNQYKYILEGFEKQWNHVGSRRLATYTNLDPGKYIFKVKGSNNDGLWNDTPTTLEITVLPPYWKTVWAYILYFIVFSTVLFSFVKLLMIKAEQAQKLELEKFHHEKDEELNKLKIQFFTNISHEIRTPLTLILSPLDQIISDGQIKGELKNQLKMIFRNVEKLFRLVNELMDFTKSEENRLKMVVQMGDIAKFAHEVYYLFIDEAHRRQIDYQFIAEENIVEAWFDKNKLEKIILNLISNAFKFTPDQGKIIVKVEKTSDTNNEGNEFINISVIDNGSGISPKYIDKVFDRFFQSPEDDAKSQSGTGIGLALVKNLVELHHGSISVTSEKCIKTCFKVKLPVGNAHFKEYEITTEPVNISSPTPKSTYLSGQNSPQNKDSLKNNPVILIVEDNAELREYIVSIFLGKYQILEASDGEAGFKIASERIPDLIISDIIMPKITGTELCKNIKENIATSHIPVILLTSKVTIEDQIEGIETGADIYITKPFNVGYLEVTIKKLIETRRKLFQRFSQEVYILPKEISNNDLDQKFLEQTIDYIHKNIDKEEITVENLAAYLTMNRSNVYRKIKALTGQTASEFIRTIRLKMAIKLIESGEYNISEIAYKTGFASPGYFTKCFKTQFGKSPSEFLSER